MTAEEIFERTNELISPRHLDFECTKDSSIYSHYFTCTKEEQKRLYWTMERWWNQNGYSVNVRDSQSLFRASDEIIELCRKSTLVDLGSGKGHALLSFALEWEFNHVKGIEVNEEYFQIAQQNINDVIQSLRNTILCKMKPSRQVDKIGML